MTMNPLGIAEKIYRDLKNEFPHFYMVLDNSQKFTDLELNIPIQDGLNYDITLNLQNIDELHFNVDVFWGQWFPCTDSNVAKNYLNAVRGFLAGLHRIKVYSRSGKSYKRLLQSQTNGKWKTEYTHASIHWPCFNPQIRYVQNGIVT